MYSRWTSPSPARPPALGAPSRPALHKAAIAEYPDFSHYSCPAMPAGGVLDNEREREARMGERFVISTHNGRGAGDRPRVGAGRRIDARLATSPVRLPLTRTAEAGFDNG